MCQPVLGAMEVSWLVVSTTNDELVENMDISGSLNRTAEQVQP